jgi:hypothetical protein
MVQAILNEHKTVTRRVLKPQPDIDGGPPLATGWFHPETADGGPGPHTFGVYGVDWHVRCPYGAPGDRLWVRETWAAFKADDRPNDLCVAYRASCGSAGEFDYAMADGSILGAKIERWTPSIHMPRWASRITLEVVSVRVERLQEITEEDARAEGVRPSDAAVVFQNDASGRPHQRSDMGMTHLGAFAILWDKINGKRAPWVSNPWVWRVEFRRVT